MKNCIICSADVKSIMHGCWDGGAVGKIDCGYGSIHDEDVIEIVLCDECITKIKNEDER